MDLFLYGYEMKIKFLFMTLSVLQSDGSLESPKKSQHRKRHFKETLHLRLC
jgi:hypothetical protein